MLQPKFEACGIPDAFVPALSILTGLVKILVLLNNHLIKSSFISKVLFFIAVPGFALVAYSHVATDLPMADNVPCVVMPALLGIVAFSGDAFAKKKKPRKKKASGADAAGASPPRRSQRLKSK